MNKQEQKHLYNAQNERSKYKYRKHLSGVGKKDVKTIVDALKHLRDYELFTKFDNFVSYNKELAGNYIEAMHHQDLSLSYMDNNIRALRDFFTWLERQKGYRSKINYNDIDYLHLSNNQRRTAKATEYKKSYTYEQIIRCIRLMPENTVIERRNKALISLQALCGLRVSELRTVKLKNLIEEDGEYFIHVNPKDMMVKFAKQRQANFMSLPEDIRQNVLQWRDYLIKQGFSSKEPLFPQIPHQFNQHKLLESCVSHEEIQSNSTIRETFKRAFERAGYDYLNPHSFRHTIVRFAEQQTPEFLNAVRQSLGHSSIATTFQSYGQLAPHEQRTRISNLSYAFEGV